jgi:hypothetical protein
MNRTSLRGLLFRNMERLLHPKEILRVAVEAEKYTYHDAGMMFQQGMHS